MALLLALFAILFGTRQIDATEHHHGMMLAVALESLVKLVAFVAVGVFAIGHLPGSEDLLVALPARHARFVAPGMPQGFLTQTLLAFAAIVCLPRQFHVAVVECSDAADVRRARWMFTGYLRADLRAGAADHRRPGQFALAGTGAAPDTYVLALPLSQGNTALALVAYVGGLSAATGMVIVASRGAGDDGQQRPGDAAAVARAAWPQHASADLGQRCCGCGASRSSRWRCWPTPTTAAPAAATAWRRSACWRSPRWRSSRRR